MKAIISGIECEFDESVTFEEATAQVDAEIANWLAAGKELGKVTIGVDGDELIVEAYERSPILRIRRITGYCANVSSFNAAKTAELKNRQKHDGRR